MKSLVISNNTEEDATKNREKEQSNETDEAASRRKVKQDLDNLKYLRDLKSINRQCFTL